MVGPFRLAPFFSPRPWGTVDLSPWYVKKPPEPIGESWLTGEQCVVDTGPFAGQTLAKLVAEHPEEILGPFGAQAEKAFPLLLKFLFPHEKLSVQVHPDDQMAQQMGQARGKTECWYVLDAKPGASVALGLRAGTTVDAIRAAVAEKTLENLLVWLPIETGDLIYVDAGTVHAIAPGSVLLETQQTSDSTFRLYDYGRPRELHLEPALKALKLKTDAGKVRPRTFADHTELIRKRYFVVERHDVAAGQTKRMRNTTGTAHCWVALSGSARIEASGADPVPLERGEAVIVPGSLAGYSLVAAEAFSGVRAMPPGASNVAGTANA